MKKAYLRVTHLNSCQKRQYPMRNPGFTLLEIMVAVTIMMIISGVSLATFTFSQRKARDAGRKNDLSQISRAMELFNEDFGSYPLGVDGEIVGCQPSADDDLDVCNEGEDFGAYPSGVYQLYMPKLPDDPKVNLDYYYESDGDGFSLYSALENDNDKDYRDDLSQECADGVTCNYLLTEHGIEVE
jgi:type II secretory pathway pseudopilin PulG